MLHYQHTSFLSSNQATELTRLGSLAEPPSKDDIIFKHPRSCMHRQTNSFPSIGKVTSICSTHRPYISIKKKKKRNPSLGICRTKVIYHLSCTDTSLEDTSGTYLEFLIGIQDGHSMN